MTQISRINQNEGRVKHGAAAYAKCFGVPRSAVAITSTYDV
jgi:hypothetical protein